MQTCLGSLTIHFQAHLAFLRGLCLGEVQFLGNAGHELVIFHDCFSEDIHQDIIFQVTDHLNKSLP